MAIPNARQYFVQQVFAPSALAANTVYLSIRNTATASPLVLGLKAIVAQTLFTGTNAAGGSLFGFQRATSGTATGGVLLTPLQGNLGADPPDVEVRFANAGLAGVSAAATAAFYHIGLASQVGAYAPNPFLVDDENLVTILPGHSLLAFAATTLATGSLATVNVRWFQVT